MAAKLPSLGGGANSTFGQLLAHLPPLSALLPTSSLNYRPLTFDLGGGGPGPQTQYGSPPLATVKETGNIAELNQKGPYYEIRFQEGCKGYQIWSQKNDKRYENVIKGFWGLVELAGISKLSKVTNMGPRKKTI